MVITFAGGWIDCWGMLGDSRGSMVCRWWLSVVESGRVGENFEDFGLCFSET